MVSLGHAERAKDFGFAASEHWTISRFENCSVHREQNNITSAILEYAPTTAFPLLKSCVLR
jgi:hypothetical protein